MDYGTDFKEERSETSFGSIFYLSHDEGAAMPILVFLHGVGASHVVWRRLIEEMLPSFNVYLLDLLGHGNSDAPDMDYTVENQAIALRELLAARGATRCYLLGHSYGAWISAYYASMHSDMQGIVLEDPAGAKEEIDDIIDSGKVQEYKESMLRQLLSMNNNKEHVMRSILKSDFVLRYQLDADLLARISARTLIVWGSDDKTVELKYADALVRGIKGSTLKVISGAGHNPHYTHAKEFYSFVEEFVNSKA